MSISMLELNKVHLMDCMEGMADIPDNYFELAIVDPPYGVGASSSQFTREGKQTGRSKCVSGLGYKKGVWDECTPDSIYFDELYRITENQIIWGVNFFAGFYRFSSGRIIWDKDNGENGYSDCEIALQTKTESIRQYKYKWHGMLQEHMGRKEKRIHPTQKPIDLYKWLLKNYAKEGDKILDTHVGSGSSIIACIDMGFEIDEDYHKAMTDRIYHFTRQENLF